ncbi:MAG: glycosyltransferase family 1 protein [Candidatus Moranbacteria bacterium]|jgi:glycosyltransferase involved in cell wall biosynthesis|nr:glycosyltransferase family 1 protein [Candidatus Moranbacteria bacterium]
MKIAIQAADLDNKRIDGTRVYLLNVLKYLGKISSEDEFVIYHKNNFNPELTPPNFPNYQVRKLKFFKLWTQTRFAYNIWKDGVDTLWMPMHNIPLVRKRNLKTVVTIHDLAFKHFPKTFPKRDLFQLNLLTDLAVNGADKIIAVSQSTKNDILKFYPKIKEEKIGVIYHGFDGDLYRREFYTEFVEEVLKKNNLKPKKYILYVGAIQPRKNLKTLVKAFEIFKKENKNNIKLVIAGGKAWCWEETISAIENSPVRGSIILTGRIPFEDLAVLQQNASAFVFPSLYEGFGIPVLEAFAAGTPVILARNSSLEEVGGEAAQYFESLDAQELSQKINKVIGDANLQAEMITKGQAQVDKFSWEKCARETLGFIKS